MKQHNYKTLGAVVNAMMEGVEFHRMDGTCIDTILIGRENPGFWKEWQVKEWEDNLDKKDILCYVWNSLCCQNIEYVLSYSKGKYKTLGGDYFERAEPITAKELEVDK